MANVDLIEYYDKKNYPSHSKAMAGLVIVFGAFFAAGMYSLWELWVAHAADIAAIIAYIQSLGLPPYLTSSVWTILIALGALILLSVVLAFGASALAKKLGGVLIYIGALFMNLMTWGIVIVLLATGTMSLSSLVDNWPIMIPGLFTLFITLLLFTVFRGRVRRAGEIIKLTGQTCLDEKGVFVPPLLTMIFTLVSALMFGAIILRFTPFEVLTGTEPWTVETALPAGTGLVLYLFTTIFFYNLAYGTTSGIVYIYMRGKDPSLGDGAKASLGVVAGLAALAVMSVVVALVRIALQRLGRQAGGVGGEAVGRAAGGVIGWIWALINYFTIPVMVGEQIGAKAGIKRSAGLVRRNFVDVMIKETAVRWGFGILAAMFFIGFAVGGAAIGWILSSGDIIKTLVFAILFIVFAAIPSTLVLRTFDIVYVTLLYVFIRRHEGEITGKTAIPVEMGRELESAYDAAKHSGR